MTNRILIISNLEDDHAILVEAALREKGSDVFFWATELYPTRSTETICFEGGERNATITRRSGEKLLLSDFQTVWNRRPLQATDFSGLHPRDRFFAKSQRDWFRKGFRRNIARDAFWVNPFSAPEYVDAKINQHVHAIEQGLMTPDTLYSNDATEIRDFMKRQGGRIVYKPFCAFSWREEGKLLEHFAAVVTESDLVSDDLLQAVPGIYQALVPRAFEVRLTMIGQYGFAAKILAPRREE